MSLESELLNLLAADSEVRRLAGSRLRLEWLEQDADLPAVTLFRVSGGRESALDMSNYFERCRMQIDCFAETYETAKSLANAVKSVLHGYTGPTGSDTVTFCGLDNETDLSFQSGDYTQRRVSLDFLITYI